LPRAKNAKPLTTRNMTRVSALGRRKW
jgi:hypothetical protein